MKERSWEELEQLSSLNLKIQKVTSKRRAAITEKKGKAICRANHIYQPGAFSYKNYPCYR